MDILTMRRAVYAVAIAVAALNAPGQAASNGSPRSHGVVLHMAAAKRVEATDAAGHPVVNWVPIEDAASVVPGDVLKYTLTGRNYAGHAVTGLTVTQPIPKGTEYLAGSAKVVSGGAAMMTASIDGAVTFSERPLIDTRGPDGAVRREAAPASRYTHLRWKFAGQLPSSGSLEVSCEVRVR